MSRLSIVSLASHTLAVFFTASAITGAAVHGQATSAQPVNSIITADGVKLKGTFYEGAKAGSPTVIMLHPIGEDKSSKSTEWKSLAEALSKAGFSVLMFDFRGHGESTTIDDSKLFWSKAVNVNNVKTKNKDTIEVKDFIKTGAAYLPVLVNDIAAARAWLERRNDESKDCNTSSLMVIGADQSASLAAIWMNSEWYRYKYTPNPKFPSFVPNPKNLESRPEGKDIIAAIFLTPQPQPEKRNVSISKLLKTACYENGTAVAIFHGKDDTKGTTFAKSLADALKPKKESKKHTFIGAVELNTKLAGVKLLQKGLGTEKAIVDYLDSVKMDRAVDRADREFLTSNYMWRSPINGQLIPAKYDPTGKKGEKNLNFDDYYKFAQ